MGMQSGSNEVVFEGIHCTLTLRRLRPGIVLAIFKGPDVGEFGQAPFKELARDLETSRRIELFVDARAVPTASLDVSNDWAQWMRTNRSSFRQINMLTGSRFVQLTADFVLRFAELGDIMRIYTEAAAFDATLTHAVADKHLDG